MDYFLIALILFGSVFDAFWGESYYRFIENHNKTPYCIERKIVHEKFKKCYIAQEVKHE